MVYQSSLHKTFPYSYDKVYDELINLKRHPLWNSGLVSISSTSRMKVGMQYETVTMIMGSENKATVEVVGLVKNKLVELRSDTGLITFNIHYQLFPEGENQTKLVCSITFKLFGIALNFAKPVIESLAKTRIQGDLEVLSAIME